MKRTLSSIVLIAILTTFALTSCAALFTDAEPGEVTEKPDDEKTNNDDKETDMPTSIEEKQAAELAGWENRFDVLSDKISADAIAQLKRLYSLYDDSVYKWLANLWDPETGAFYYANSARDYDGFLPDIESTRQLLAIIRTSGMVDIYKTEENSTDDAAFASVFPKEFADQIVAFVKSCQDPDDGYFYHKQWGKQIGAARRGRDLDQAITLLELFGAEPDYPTAIDRLEGAGATSSLGVSTVRAVSSLVSSAADTQFDFLVSKEACKKYLDSFDITADSHNTGHTIGSWASQWKASGLIDYVCDYFDEIQERVYQEQLARGEKPTGLWQPVINYTSLSGLYKIGGIYSTANRSMNYLDECVESAIECIKQDDYAGIVIYVFNPWAGLNAAIASMKRAVNRGDTRYNLDATYTKVRGELAELISVTYDKLHVFAKDSGGFSYNVDTSLSVNQGVFASLGRAEGDVNATNIATNSIPNMIFNVTNLTRVSKWNSKDFDTFLEIMADAEPIDKIARVNKVIDFESYNVGDIPTEVTAASPSGVREDKDGNLAMCFSSVENLSSKNYINISLSDDYSCAIFEFDMMMPEAQTGYTHQIKIRGQLGNTYMITLTKNSNGTVKISDSSNHTGGIAGTLSAIIDPNKWTHVRFEIYAGVESDLARNGFVVKLYIDGEFVDYSTNYFGPTTSSTTEILPSVSGLSLIEVYSMAKPSSELWIDNIFCDLRTDMPFEEE